MLQRDQLQGQVEYSRKIRGRARWMIQGKLGWGQVDGSKELRRNGLERSTIQ